MGQPYVGEIRMFGGNFAPAGWELCDGRLLPISEFDTLFNLIGTTYGGDGQSTFAVPNLCGRGPVHMGLGPGLQNNYQIGEFGGVEQVTLTTQQIPQHNHLAMASSFQGGSTTPANNVWAATTDLRLYMPGANQTQPQLMAPGALAPTGGSQPHENMPPFLVINFIISAFGVFPSQT